MPANTTHSNRRPDGSLRWCDGVGPGGLALRWFFCSPAQAILGGMHDRSHLPTRLTRLGEEPDDDHIARLTPGERVALVWPMTLQAWAFKTGDVDESRLRRILSALSAAGVEFLVVGAYAMAAHGVPRATGDIDIWVRSTPENADRVLQALRAFGAPLFDLSCDDLLRPDVVFQIGVAPNRIDILTGITGVAFEDAWRNRLTVSVESRAFPSSVSMI